MCWLSSSFMVLSRAANIARWLSSRCRRLRFFDNTNGSRSLDETVELHWITWLKVDLRDGSFLTHVIGHF
jgi:hypothetical protein